MPIGSMVQSTPLKSRFWSKFSSYLRTQPLGLALSPAESVGATVGAAVADALSLGVWLGWLVLPGLGVLLGLGLLVGLGALEVWVLSAEGLALGLVGAATAVALAEGVG